MKLVKAPVKNNNGDGTLTVDLQGATLPVPCTMTALAAQTGDTVLIETIRGTAIATGIVARRQGLKILWEGAWYMQESQTVNLSEPISMQPTGIVLHWQAYSGSEVYNHDHNYFFVPKNHVVSENGEGVTMLLASSTGTAMCTKYVYVRNTQVTGNANNNKDAFTAGAGFTNTPRHWVLTQVLGV